MMKTTEEILEKFKMLWVVKLYPKLSTAHVAFFSPPSVNGK